MRDDGITDCASQPPADDAEARALPTRRTDPDPRTTAVPSATPTPSHGDPVQPGEQVDLLALAGTLWRGRWRIIGAALLAVLFALAYLAGIAVPEYRATAVVALEEREQSIVDFDNVLSGLSGEQASVNTEIEVIRSRGLIERLVTDLDLLSDPEFNPTLDGPPLSLAGALADRVEAEAMPLLAGIPTLGAILADSDRMTEEAAFDRTVEAVRDQIGVSNIRDSLVFRVTTRTHDAEKSARMANALADLYIDDQIRVKFEATARASEWLGERVSELREDLDAAQDRLLAFTAETRLVTPEEVAALNRQIADLRERLSEASDRAATAGESSRAASQAQALSRTLADLEAQLDRQSEGLVEQQELERGVAQAQLIFDYFETRLRETAVQQNLQEPDARLLGRAVVPPEPFAPQPILVLVVAALLGLGVGAGIVILRELRQTGLRSGEALEAATGHVVLAELPRIATRSRDALLDHVATKPNSRLAEAFRNLRTSVAMSDIDNPPQVIASTSSVPGEGKTTQSQLLALGFAGLGKRVLLVECDLRRRTFAETLGLPDEFGLVAVLSGAADLADAVQSERRLPGVEILLADRESGSANPVDLFASARFRSFVGRARREYDVVILDTPPVLAVPDARVIAPLADVTLYAVKWDDTPRAAVREGLRMLELVGARLAGLVLTQVDAKGMERYGSQGYGSYGQGYYAE